jgi:outer membrane protein assembly factor BamA
MVMRWWRRLGLVILGVSSLIAFPPAIRPQCPRGSESRLRIQRAHAPLSEEVKLRQDETEEGAPLRKVHARDVTIEGAPELEGSIKGRIESWLPEDGFESDEDWIDAVEQAARDVLRDNGYFRAKVSARAHVLSRDSAEELVSLDCQVTEEQQYRLSDIQIDGAHVFPAEGLRSRVPLDDGDIFDLGKIRKGLEAWTRLYASLGYINFTASPELKVSEDRQLISVVFNLEESHQFRVGSVKVVGLDREDSRQALKMKLKPGDIFNNDFVDDFFKDNKPLLPADVSRWDNVEIEQDPKNDTVSIVFDVSPCPQPSVQ